MNNLSEAFLQKLRTELRSGEKLVWAEQPIAGQQMKTGYLAWLFFVPWTLFALFWIAGAASMMSFKFNDFHLFNLFPMFGIPFVLIGLYGLYTPFKMRNKANNTVYAVTNLRLLICNFGKNTEVQAFYAKDVTHINRIEKPDGSGDLYFSTEHYRDSDGDRQTRKEGFTAVRDVKQLERTLEDFIQQNQSIKT